MAVVFCAGRPIVEAGPQMKHDSIEAKKCKDKEEKRNEQ